LLGLADTADLPGRWIDTVHRRRPPNPARPAERVVAFYNQRSTAEQWIKEGKGAVKWTRLLYRTFAATLMPCASS
jgi:hypothetical protein